MFWMGGSCVKLFWISVWVVDWWFMWKGKVVWNFLYLIFCCCIFYLF